MWRMFWCPSTPMPISQGCTTFPCRYVFEFCRRLNYARVAASVSLLAVNLCRSVLLLLVPPLHSILQTTGWSSLGTFSCDTNCAIRLIFLLTVNPACKRILTSHNEPSQFVPFPINLHRNPFSPLQVAKPAPVNVRGPSAGGRVAARSAALMREFKEGTSDKPGPSARKGSKSGKGNGESDAKSQLTALKSMLGKPHVYGVADRAFK